jgi:hypothetical protein
VGGNDPPRPSRKPLDQEITMRTLRHCKAYLAAALLVLAATIGAAPPEKLVLFDGKSLQGWTKTDFSRPGAIRVENGAIVLSQGHAMTGITTTRRDLPVSNYELTYEASRLDGRDFFAAATFPVGKSHITLVNGGWGGHVTGLSSLDGSDASENETTNSYNYKDDTFYRFRVWVTDKGIRCWIDDAKVVAVSLEGHTVDTRIEVDANKPLGFATYETTGAVRKIEIRTLSPAEVAENDKAVE